MTPPEATQGRSLPPAVPETLAHREHWIVDGNAAHVSWGGAVLVDPRVELVDVAELVELGVGMAVPGSEVFVSPQDVNSMPRSRRGTVHCHNLLRFIVLPARWTLMGAYTQTAEHFMNPESVPLNVRRIQAVIATGVFRSVRSVF